MFRVADAATHEDISYLGSERTSSQFAADFWTLGQPKMADEAANNLANDADNRPLNARLGLVCVGCGNGRLKVVYTRHGANGRIVRRRECKKCGKRITTWERMIGQVQMCNDGAAE
jgi:hypothetical protein